MPKTTPIKPDLKSSSDNEANKLLAHNAPGIKPGNPRLHQASNGNRSVGGKAVKGGARTKGGSL